MINLNHLNSTGVLPGYRVKTKEILELYGSYGDHQNGVFVVPSPIDHQDMLVIASVGEGWEHVSVSRKNRCPNWPEMEAVKRKFFAPSDVCMQLHVAVDDHINCHDHCLHIWKPTDLVIPLPPSIFVAPAQEVVT
jgi:hypothetical protein